MEVALTDRVTSRRCLMHCRLVLFFDNLVVVIGILKNAERARSPAVSQRSAAVSRGVLPRLMNAALQSDLLGDGHEKSEKVFQLLRLPAMEV